MQFNHFLTSYMPDSNIGFNEHFKNMIEQAVLAEKLGYAAVSIPEHHLVNLLMMPAPLQMAVKIACLTKRIKIRIKEAQIIKFDISLFGLSKGTGKGWSGFIFLSIIFDSLFVLIP